MFGEAKNGLTGNNRILVVMLVFIIINALMTGFGYYLLFDRFDRADSLVVYKNELARDISDYSYRLAVELGVNEVSAVREALAEYTYALDFAVGSDDLIQIILNQGRTLQDTIIESADARLKEQILTVVNSDARVIQTDEKTHLYIRIADGGVTVFPEQVLESATQQIINTLINEYAYHGSQNVDLEIEKGMARMIVPQTVEEQMQALTDDLNSARLKFHEVRVQAGLAEMVGPGITLYVYDAEGASDSGSIVHDVDIRDVVNELFSAGAKGISVGGERLIVNSSIRCSGPLIMVNYRQIPTNPVVIEAIGDPDLLISGLSIITNELESKRGLSFVVNHSGFIKLSAYSGVE